MKSKIMNKIIYITISLLCSFGSIVISQTLLESSCDYKKYPINGCEDELGAECDTSTSQCRCKTGNWVVVDNRFCFPVQCSKGQYYDHNYGRCESQRKAALNSEDNYCKYNFHCRGDNIHCQNFNEWNYRCVCNRGFIYDTSTQECQQLKGLNGFCSIDEDCDVSQMRQLVCADKSCQCAQGFTYNNNIDGCESNERIKERDSQLRKMIFLFIGLGVFFGAALSMKFGASSHTTAQQLLLKRIVENRRQQRLEEEQRQQQRLDEEQQTTIDLDPGVDRTENLINKVETA